MAYAAAGKIELAQGIIDELERLEGKRYVLPYNIAKIHATADNREKAFECLERANQEGNPDLIELNSEPVFDKLRSALRFSELMQRIGWKT